MGSGRWLPTSARGSCRDAPFAVGAVAETAVLFVWL